MKKDNISNFKRGWFIGDFEPALLQTKAFEIAMQNYPAGHVEQTHFHKIATEITCIVSGIARFNDEVVIAGELITISPEERVQFEAITEVITIVVKTPSVTDDKYLTGVESK